MLTTTIAPTSGRAHVAGFDVARQPIAARRASAVVFQEPVVDRSLTGRRNLDVHARLWGLDTAAAKRRIAAVVDPFGLGEVIDRPVDSYSGGQRRRLEIARALVSEPPGVSSTSPRWASTPVSVSSCSTSSPVCGPGRA